MKKYEEMWRKIKDLIKSTNNKSDDCDKKFMKIKLYADDDLPQKKTLELHNTIKVVSPVSNDANKNYPQISLGTYL